MTLSVSATPVGPVVGSIIAIIVFVLLMNLYMVYFRNMNRRKSKKSSHIPTTYIGHFDDYKLSYEHEQADYARRVALQNRTFELFEQVRRDAAAREAAEASGGAAAAAGDDDTE
jgi:low temperature requirement protein LtrA